MIDQILFPICLYVFGVMIGLLFKRHLPFPFICFAAFFWGALLWVVIATMLLSFAIPYTLLNMGCVLTTFAIFLSYIHIKRKMWRFNAHEIMWLVGTLSAFIFIIGSVVKFNFSAASYDSIAQIMLGRTIGYEGLTEFTKSFLASWGVFVPLMHSASVFWEEGYWCTLHPAFFFSFVMTFCYLCYRSILMQIHNTYVALVLSLLATILFISTYFIVFQIFYIHNNFIAAAYLFIAVITFWLALCEERNEWFWVAITAMLGFSVTRTESPLFALIFLSIIISSRNISYRNRVAFIVPFLVVLVVWYAKLLRMIGSGTDILDPEKIVAIIVLLITFGLLTVFSFVRWIERYIVAKLHVIMIVVFLVILAITVIHNPVHMLKSLSSIVLLMLIGGRWGATWFLLIGLLIFAFKQSHFKHEKIFSVGIISYFILLLALSSMRSPYRIHWGESANRMLTHILPIILFYIMNKYAFCLSRVMDSDKDCQNHFFEKIREILKLKKADT